MRRAVRCCKGRRRREIDKNRGGRHWQTYFVMCFFSFFSLRILHVLSVITGFFLCGLMGLEYVTKNWKGMGFLFLFFSSF